MLAPNLEPIVRGGRTFGGPFHDLFFGTSAGGTPWTDVGLPWGTSGPILSTSWKMLVASLLEMLNNPEQLIAQTTPSKNTSKDSNNLH